MGRTKFANCIRFFVEILLISTLPFCFGDTDPRDDAINSLPSLLQSSSFVAAINALFVSLGYPPLPGWLLVGGDPCGQKWTGVDCVFSNITAIGANLGGELGDSLEFFESIISIDFSNNHISGPIPPALPPTLRNFSLSSNQFSGSIPSTLSSLSQLLDLSVNKNLLSGELPDAFQQLTSLIHLDISDNGLNGQLPASLGNLLSLNTLHLQNNQLSGTLDVLQDLPLADLNIENNLFSGPIPAKLLAIPNFRKDGNPFNTSIILPPPAPAPAPASFPFPGAPSSEGSSGEQANAPSGSETYTSNKPSKFFTAKRITLLAIIGIAIIILLGFLLILSRCLRKRKEKNHSDAAFVSSRERSNFSESSVLQRNLERAVPKEIPLNSQDKFGIDNRLTGFTPNPQKESALNSRDRFGIDNRLTGFTPNPQKTRDVTRAAAVGSSRNKEHGSDSSDMSGVFLPPPPPPPSSLFEKTESMAKPLTSKRPTKTLNPHSVQVFSIATLQQFTDSFSQENFVGIGMLGSVYKAELPSGKMCAVKKLSIEASKLQSDEEFLEMVSNMSKIRHNHIVGLMGYCSEHGQRLVVHEYCENGTLYDGLHVYEEIHRRLSWKMRIRVALGAARALEYLHEGCQPSIVHKNFKSANLLFDDKLKVYVSDCGFAPLLSSGSASQSLGRILMSSGYGAPEFESGSYSCKSDVYSFGVVMLELLTGRSSCDRSRPRGEQFLVRWAVPQLHDIDTLSRMVDPSLNGVYPVKSLSRFADIISLCVQREPEFRPPMSEIVQELLQMT